MENMTKIRELIELREELIIFRKANFNIQAHNISAFMRQGFWDGVGAAIEIVSDKVNGYILQNPQQEKKIEKNKNVRLKQKN